MSSLEKLTTDMRFTLYNILYKRILVIWIFSAFMVLIGILFRSIISNSSRSFDCRIFFGSEKCVCVVLLHPFLCISVSNCLLVSLYSCTMFYFTNSISIVGFDLIC